MLLKQVNKQIEKCHQCRLHDLVDVNCKFGPTYGYGGNMLMICGIAPSCKREGSKKPLSRDEENRTAKIMFDAFDVVKWPESKTFFTNLLKCSLPENRKPEQDEVDTCTDCWFSQELMLINPIAVVALGTYVDEYLNTKLADRKFPIFKIEHFSYINRRRDLYDRWCTSWSNILKETKEQAKRIIRATGSN